MSDIYLDSVAAAMPDAADQLRHLTETGHRLHVLGEAPPGLSAALEIEQVSQLPSSPPTGSWLLTASPELCADRRPPLSSMFIGPRPAPSPRPAPRCDADARDMAAAVLEILRREAMG
ncbi:MAG TPA: hypothetical protein VFV72_01405 [Candidatus Limnocylindrales bacterium]|nr:hypothetical protein [Candidatus Limnocylindrales bacterium]